MERKSLVGLWAIILLFQFSMAQEDVAISWWNPAESNSLEIEGQAWPGQVASTYHRLPKQAGGVVREAVWNLSKHSAGLSLRFSTDAKSITVRYKVKGNHAMPHMPATGVSGVDLYAKTSDGDWRWFRGKYSFADTIQYKYSNIDPKEKYHDKGREYQLYLPLYNEVEWLEIGVPEDAVMEPLPLRQEKPIVVYGTSIAHGACASRPGMAWTSILGRKMDRPLINLAFSGNGRMEEEVINYITELDAKIFVLDCLPNLGATKDRSLDDVRQLIISGIKQIRTKRPSTPILLVEHDGYSDGAVDADRYKTYTDLNRIAKEAFAQLKSDGLRDIHLLTKEELNLSMESFVDGTHPTDLGMMEYAVAYEKALREILKEPMGSISTTIPVTQAREPEMYPWEGRHQELLRMNRDSAPKICFFGNSITHYWGGSPKAILSSGADSWKANLDELEVRNFGFGWDRVENVLWRIYHDELDGFESEQIVLMIGTNNEHLNTDEEILIGLEMVINAIKERQPKARLLLLGLFPRVDKEERMRNLNTGIAALATSKKVDYADIGGVLLDKDNKIDASLFSDGLHPNAKGYRKVGKKLNAILREGTK
ncbi:SGNH/GDSL hydrolase family protein [Arenibacter palladensis]|uniref:SGNH/GDSL hydrolase family protein n=1 Tax=Arenibacter palladensis TaxID=237373 RepID=UPI0026E3E4EB|nr:SGNH/GDSL hydrolase family protein [Arenibacter palladensis]MDO6604229.1 SGNH/GDSL hydrolase family protein [Arenibacter palladensis]